MRDTFPHIKTRMAWLLNARLQVLVPCCLALLALLLAGGISPELAAALDVPPYRGYVNDYGAMMSPALELKLEQVLQSFDLNDSTQIAILTIDTLAGDALEDFSIRVVEQWKIGQRGKDNGVLFLAVKKDRKLRIEVGRGLEHALTDLAAGRIIDSVVAPRFKAGRFDEGFETGINAIIQATKGEYGAEPRPRAAAQRESPLSRFIGCLCLGMSLVGFLSSASRRFGIAAGAVLLPLLVFFGRQAFTALPASIGLVPLLLFVPIGLTLGFVCLIFGFYEGGGFGGSDGSGGSGGFGGFGGGSFGGGGASGNW